MWFLAESTRRGPRRTGARKCHRASRCRDPPVEFREHSNQADPLLATFEDRPKDPLAKALAVNIDPVLGGYGIGASAVSVGLVRGRHALRRRIAAPTIVAPRANTIADVGSGTPAVI